MKFSKNDQEYLKGDKFSNGHQFKVADLNQTNISRLDFLETYSFDKKVLHIGFTDHIPLIEEKINRNEWLHNRLIKSSKLCIGIDLNKDAVEFVKQKIGISNVFCLDIIKDQLPDIISGEKFDLVIIGEVLEHIDNPVDFLKTIHSRLNRNADELIITVPNALDFNNLKMIRKGIEWINTDHRYWFTPFTLSKVLINSHFTVNNFFYSQTFFPSNKIERFLIKRYPMLRETVIAISDF